MRTQEAHRLQTVFDFMLATCSGHAKDVEDQVMRSKDYFTPHTIMAVKLAAQDAALAYAALANQCMDLLEEK